MLGRISVLMAVAVVLVAGGASQASAQFGIAPGGFGLGFFDYSAYGNLSHYRIPYYALYPPVYYSYPVARPYGYSPFAYPPGTLTPEVAPAQAAPVEYRNPFVPQSDGAAAEKTAATPRMYYNPFVSKARFAGTLAAGR